MVRKVPERLIDLSVIRYNLSSLNCIYKAKNPVRADRQKKKVENLQEFSICIYNVVFGIFDAIFKIKCT